MDLGGVSHLAFGVRDMDRSLAFLLISWVWRSSDRTNRWRRRRCTPTRRRPSAGGWPSCAGPTTPTPRSWCCRRSQPPPAALRLDQVGIHHVALWVRDLASKAERLKAAGVRFVMEPSEVDARGYGGHKGERS